MGYLGRKLMLAGEESVKGKETSVRGRGAHLMLGIPVASSRVMLFVAHSYFLA